MIQLQGQDIALTATGGVDSTVLAHWICQKADSIQWLSPTKTHTSKTHLRLIAADFGQANWDITQELVFRLRQNLKERYSDRFTVSYEPITFGLPTWSLGSGILKQGYVPEEADEKVHYDNQRTYRDCFIEGRNAILFSVLLSYCSYKKVPLLLTGHQYEWHEWEQLDSWKMRTEDVSPMFIDRMNLVNECGYSFRTRIQAPFFDLRFTKYDIVKLGLELGVDIGKDTYSCLNSPACGKCDNCIIRRKTLAIHGVKDSYA